MMITKQRAKFHSHSRTRSLGVKGRRWSRMPIVVEKQEPLTCLRNIKTLIQQSMKEKGITPEQARKSLGIKRYEK